MASSKTSLFLIVCVFFAFVLLVSSRATPDVRTIDQANYYKRGTHGNYSALYDPPGYVNDPPGYVNDPPGYVPVPPTG
ncbi:hypothetical protein EZV62_020713 [Acer yangbiense]|uniref:Uncharacterized protein n=1 Tax=Acer yangbiense TaxID=1000413 RepID=A0A5C7HER5_9ROSI|nr:hypothetical protein EZV62_020713 [Acer yangbiense]